MVYGILFVWCFLGDVMVLVTLECLRGGLAGEVVGSFGKQFLGVLCGVFGGNIMRVKNLVW